MKEIIINFGEILQELNNKNLKMFFRKGKPGIFIQDCYGNEYQIEINYSGSYLDKLIENNITAKFEKINSKIVKEYEKEVWSIKDIQDFIKINKIHITKVNEKKEHTLKNNELEYLEAIIKNKMIFSLYHEETSEEGIEDIQMYSKNNCIYVKDEAGYSEELFVFRNEENLPNKSLKAIINYFLDNYTYKDLVKLKEECKNKAITKERKEIINKLKYMDENCIEDKRDILEKETYKVINMIKNIKISKKVWILNKLNDILEYIRGYEIKLVGHLISSLILLVEQISLLEAKGEFEEDIVNNIDNAETLSNIETIDISDKNLIIKTLVPKESNFTMKHTYDQIMKEGKFTEEDLKINEIIKVTKKQYLEITEHLLKDYTFLIDKLDNKEYLNSNNAIAIICKSKETLIIKPNCNSYVKCLCKIKSNGGNMLLNIYTNPYKQPQKLK